MNRSLLRLLLPFVVMLSLRMLIVEDSRAQTNVGTTVGQFLLIEPSARVAGMGNAGVTISDEAMGAFFNPAALGRADRAQAQFGYSQWLADINYNYVIATVPVGNGSFMVSMTSLESGEIDVRTVAQPLGTGERYTVSDVAYGVGYGMKVTDRVSAGIQVKFMQETIWHSSISAFAMDVGTLFKLSEDGLVIGASLSNFGTRARYDGRDLRVRYDFDPKLFGDNSSLPAQLYTDEFGLPILFRVGLQYSLQFGDNHRIVLVADAFHPNDNTESVSVGGEYTFAGTLSLRAGYQNLWQQDSEVGLTLGAGVGYDLFGADFQLDYGWTDFSRLGAVQRLTLGLLF